MGSEDKKLGNYSWTEVPENNFSDWDNDSKIQIQPSQILHFSHTNSDYVLEPFEWTWAAGILAVVLSLIIMCTIFGNSFVLYDFFTRVRHDIKARSPTHFFIANLSLADLLVGIFVLPFLATFQVTGRWYLGQCFCNIWVCTHFWLCAASILSTCSVCIERFIGVSYPIEHMRILNSRRIFIMVIAVWIAAGIPSVVRVFAWTEPRIEIPYVCKINQKIGHAILACIGIFYTPGIIMVILYWRIYRIAAKHMNAIKRGYLEGPGGLRYKLSIGGQSGSTLELKSSGDTEESDIISSRNNSIDVENLMSPEKKQQKSNKSESNQSKKKKSQSQLRSSESITKKQINLAKRLSFLVGILLLSYGPYFSLILVRSIHPLSVPEHLFNSFAWIRYFNSCINPVIYAYAVPTYHQAFIKFLQRLRFWR